MRYQDRFSPSFLGCVTKDLRMAKVVERLYHEELESVDFYLYRCVLTQETVPELFELFEELAEEEVHHFLILGRLLRALGGDPSLRFQMRMPHVKSTCEENEDRRAQTLLYESLKGERRACSFYRALIGYTDDGVIRSVLSYLLEEEMRHEEKLNRFFG